MMRFVPRRRISVCLRFVVETNEVSGWITLGLGKLMYLEVPALQSSLLAAAACYQVTNLAIIT